MTETISIKPVVFISYSHNQEDFKIATEIDTDLTSVGVRIKRDVKDVEYKDSFKDFMKDVRSTDYVLLLLSDNFLKSPNCMFEILELLKDDDYINRILPVIVGSLDIFNPIGRITYVKYWEERERELEKVIAPVEERNKVGLNEDLRHYHNISQNVGEFLSVISKLKCISYQDLRNENYKSLLKAMDLVENSQELIETLFSIKTIPNEGERNLAINDFIDEHSNEFDGYFLKGILSEETGNFELARDCYSKCIELNGSSVEAWSNRGNIYNKLGKRYRSNVYYKRALADLNNANAIDEHVPEVYNNRGNSYNGLGKFDLALKDFKRALFYRPDYELAMNNMGNSYNRKADYFNKQGKTKDAIENYKKAVKCYDQAIHLFPDYTSPYINKGKAFDDLGLVYIKGSSSKKKEIAKEYWEKALLVYNEAIELDEDRPSVYNNKGKTLVNLKRFNEAIDVLKQAIGISPNYTKAHLNIGKAYFGLGGLSDACQSWNIAAKGKDEEFAKEAKELLKQNCIEV